MFPRCTHIAARLFTGLLFVVSITFSYAGIYAQEILVGVPVAQPQRDLVTVTHEIEPMDDAPTGRAIAFQMRLQTVNAPKCYGAPAKPVDAIAVLDTSPSAGAPAPGSNLFHTQEILRSLWMQIDQPIYESGDDPSPERSRLSILTVDIGVTGAVVNLRLPLTDTTSAITATITGLTTGADSRFYEGIDAASEHLRSNARPDVEQALVIVLHDSFFALQDEVIAAAQRALADGISVFVIGNTLNIPLEEKISNVEAAPLVASLAHVLLDPGDDDLRRLFVAAAGGSEKIAAHGLVALVELTPAGVAAIIETSAAGEQISDTAARWRIAQLGHGEEAQLGFTFRIDRNDVSNPGVVNRLLGLDCNGFQFEIASESPSPTMPAPEISSEGNTPDVNAVATAVLPTEETPMPDSDAGGLQVGPISLPVWLVWLLLGLIALSLLFWLISRLRRDAGSRRPPPLPPELPPPPPPPGDEKTVNSGNTILPGGSSKELDEIRRMLSTAQVIEGNIPVNYTGQQRSGLIARWLESAQEAEQTLSFAPHNSTFVWNNNGGAITLPFSLLLGVVCERVKKQAPVFAVYTKNPVCHLELHVQIDKTDTSFTAQVVSRRPTNVNGVAQPAQAFWRLHLRFIENSTGKRLEQRPIEEK